MELVSVIIPMYNASKFLNDNVNCLLNQTYLNCEFIYINDNSTDDSLDVLKTCEDKRLKIINNSDNLGAGPSRDKGVSKAKGKYIYFCDADDTLDHDYIENLVKNIDGFECSVSSYKLADENGNEEFVKVQNRNQKNYRVKSVGIINDYLGFCLAMWNKLFIREVIINNNIKFGDIRRGQDSVLVFKYFLEINSVNVFHNDSYYNHNINNSDSITKTIKKEYIDGFIELSKIFKIYKVEEYKFKKHRVIKLYRQYKSQCKSIKRSNIDSKLKKEYLKVLKRNKKKNKIGFIKFFISLFFVRKISIKRKISLLMFVTFDSFYDKIKRSVLKKKRQR